MIYSRYNIMIEGQQADEYRDRKRKEEERQKELDRARYSHNRDRSNLNNVVGDRVTNQYIAANKDKIDDPEFKKYLNKKRDEDTDRLNVSDTSIRKNNDDRYGNAKIRDAINKHMRRHPEKYKESGMFESCVFLND